MLVLDDTAVYKQLILIELHSVYVPVLLEWMADGWRDGWMDGWMDEGMDAWRTE